MASRSARNKTLIVLESHDPKRLSWRVRKLVERLRPEYLIVSCILGRTNTAARLPEEEVMEARLIVEAVPSLDAQQNTSILDYELYQWHEEPGENGYFVPHVQRPVLAEVE